MPVGERPAGGAERSSPWSRCSWFDQEARVYALLALSGMLLTGAMLRWRAEAHDHRRAVLWSACAALVVFVHYPGWVLVAGQVLVLAVLRVVPLRRLAAALAGPLIAVAVSLPQLREHQAGGRTDWITETSLPTRALLVPKQAMAGLESAHETDVAGGLLLLLAVLVVAALVPSAGSAVPVRDRAVSAARLVVSVTAAGMALYVVGGLVGVDIVLTRNLVVLVPGVVLVAALGATRLVASRRWLAAVPVLLLAGMVTVALEITVDPEYRRPDWAGAFERVPDDARVVVVAPSTQTEVAAVYEPTLRAAPPARPSGIGHSLEVVAGDVIANGESFDAPSDLTVNGSRYRRASRQRHGRVTHARYERVPSAVPAGTVAAEVITDPAGPPVIAGLGSYAVLVRR